MGSWTCFTTALSVILALAAVAPTDALDLIRDGKAVADVYYQNDAPQQVQDAATEIARVLSLMGSVKVQAAPVTDEGHVARNKPAILVGQLAEQAGLKMDRRSRANDGFRYKVDANRLMLVGESPRGVFIGANRLLQQLGANWYVPGEVGEVIPKKRTVAVPDDLEHSAVSDSIHRRIWYGGGGSRGKSARATDLWLRRHNGDLLRGSWRHAYSALVPKKAFEEHPEWFSYDANRGERCTRQLCTTNPQVIRLGAENLLKKMAGSEDFVFPAGPNDGGGLCECAKCKELRSVGYNEPSSNEPVASTQVFQFASALADITSKEYPDRDLGILVYSDYSRIPKKMGKVNPNVFPMIAPIRRCRLHGPGNPNCQWNQLWDDEIQGWAELSSKLAFYIYNYNLADTLVPLPKTAYYRRLLDSVDRAGIRELGWTIESIDSWATHAPAFWLASQLTWNSDVNVDQSMDQFYRGFYGNAYKPMKSYWTRIDKAYETANVHTGSQYGLHHIWVPELLQASRQDITQAKKFARGDREKEAVAMADAGLKAAELFMKSWNALGDFEFLKARQYEEQLEQLISKHAERQPTPNWFHGLYAYDRYHKRFVGRPIFAGAELIDQGAEIVVKLPDHWKLKTDERGVGVEQGWCKPSHATDDWRSVGTFTQSWADLDLGFGGFYHGDVWYRTTFDLPASASGEDLRLWFGGFDHNVDVYINGKHLGELTGFVKPQELDEIASSLKYGSENVLAVRTNSGGLAELGTGGIMFPVMIYNADEVVPQQQEGKEEGIPAYKM